MTPTIEELPGGVEAGLLSFSLWRQALTQYALATHLGVALVDPAGTMIGECLNPQPIWSLLQAREKNANACPFSVSPLDLCNCITDSYAKREPVIVKDAAGLVHFAVPLTLHGKLVGAILAGQVFDHHPQTLPIERLARTIGANPTHIWDQVRLAMPIRPKTLRAYAELLTSLAVATLESSYNNLLQSRELARTRKRVKQTESSLLDAETRLQKLSRRLLQDQDEQRKAMARDLHDDFAQRLTSLSIQTHLLQKVPGLSPDMVEQMTEIGQNLELVCQDMLRIAHQLHPSRLEHLGFASAMKALAKETAEARDQEVTVKIREFPTSVPDEVSLCLYRVAQEAFTNALRHAGEARIRLTVQCTGKLLRMVVHDTGKGFDRESYTPGLGLISMEERVRLVDGTFQVRSRPGRGTSIIVCVPLGTIAEPSLPA